jgi:hypothetical protein
MNYGLFVWWNYENNIRYRFFHLALFYVKLVVENMWYHSSALFAKTTNSSVRMVECINIAQYYKVYNKQLELLNIFKKILIKNYSLRDNGVGKR